MELFCILTVGVVTRPYIFVKNQNCTSETLTYVYIKNKFSAAV